METRQRILIVAIAAVLALGAFVVARPENADEAVPDRPSPAATETRPDSGETAAEGTGGSEAPAGGSGEREAPAQPEAQPRPEVPQLTFRDGEVAGGSERIEVSQGDLVRMDIQSDVPEEVHIHGYDRYVDLEPGETARVRFRADLEGVFEVELHESGAQLAELRVGP